MIGKNDQPIKWLRSKAVREMLGISDSTLQTMRINGTIPAYKLGPTWFYREEEILSTLFANRAINAVIANG
jgi:hypothetical protein